MEKKNCWEFMRCGREKGGRRSGPQGVCPASTFEPFDRLHGGSAAGRVCWAVDNTLCSGNASGHFSMKLYRCSRCSFYRAVISEERGRVRLTTDILSIIDQRVNARPSGDINWRKWIAEGPEM